MGKNISASRLAYYAGSGDAVAFKSKGRATRYAAGVRRGGYATEIIRSSGPVVDAPGRVRNAYYVVPTKKKKVKNIWGF